MNITILGAGAWGTALARLLHQGKHQVTLWGHIPAWLDEIRQTGRNDRFLPGIDLPRELVLQPDLPQAIKKMLSDARPYAEGRGIRFTPRTVKDVATIVKLVELKTAPK